jgi:hypothetical protein
MSRVIIHNHLPKRKTRDADWWVEYDYKHPNGYKGHDIRIVKAGTRAEAMEKVTRSSGLGTQIKVTSVEKDRD